MPEVKIPPLSDELRAILQQGQQPQGSSCQVLQLGDNKKSKNMVAALTAQSPGGGGHELLSDTRLYDPNRTTLIVNLENWDEDASDSEEEDIPLKDIIAQLLPRAVQFIPSAPGVILMSSHVSADCGADLARILNKAVTSTEGIGCVTQFPSGDFVFYNDHGAPMNCVTPDGHCARLAPAVFVPRYIAMCSITPPIDPQENYRCWMEQSNDFDFNTQIRREQSRRQFGPELEVVAISDERADIGQVTHCMCKEELYSRLRDEEGHGTVFLSGGHKEVENASGYRTTFVNEHGNQDPNAGRHEHWVDRIIEATFCRMGTDYPAILSVCQVKEADALRIARESNRPVIFSPGVVAETVTPLGDCKLDVEGDQQFYKAFPYGRIEPYGKFLYLSRSPRVDMALREYQGDYEEEEDIPVLDSELQCYPGIEKLHQMPFDFGAFGQAIAQQLEWQRHQITLQQEGMHYQERQRGPRVSDSGPRFG